MNADLLGKCGFYCGSCPSYLSSSCSDCMEAHRAGDCFTRDCVLEKKLRFCGQCPDFPCDTILIQPRCTVLDKDWLIWKRNEKY